MMSRKVICIDIFGQPKYYALFKTKSVLMSVNIKIPCFVNGLRVGQYPSQKNPGYIHECMGETIADNNLKTAKNAL